MNDMAFSAFLMLTSRLTCLPVDDLELREEGGDSRVLARRALDPGTTWGPYAGILRLEGSTDDQEAEVRALMCSLSSNLTVHGSELLSLSFYVIKRL